MEEKKISREDLIELMRCARNIASLHVKYIKVGFRLPEIASTFARIYYDQLRLQLNEEAVKIVNRQLAIDRKHSDFRASDKPAIAANVCLRMSTAFIETVCKITSKPKSR